MPEVTLYHREHLIQFLVKRAIGFEARDWGVIPDPAVEALIQDYFEALFNTYEATMDAPKTAYI